MKTLKTILMALMAAGLLVFTACTKEESTTVEDVEEAAEEAVEEAAETVEETAEEVEEATAE